MYGASSCSYRTASAITRFRVERGSREARSCAGVTGIYRKRGLGARGVRVVAVAHTTSPVSAARNTPICSVSTSATEPSTAPAGLTLFPSRATLDKRASSIELRHHRHLLGDHA